MTDMHTSEITETDGVISGPLRRSVNAASGVQGSIHDDATAQRLGLRGGTVAGSVHLDLFPPLLLEAFGNRWFERGSLSINFRNPTVDREPVRAYVRRPAAGAPEDGVQMEAWIDREDGLRVGDGTVAVGQPSEPSALRALDLHRFPPGELRILEGVAAGDDIPPVEVTIAAARQQNMLEQGLVTEPLAWYSGESPWGAPIALPQIAVHHLYQAGATHLGRTVNKRGGGVGLFGAIELANLAGPLLLGTTYTMSGTILAVGQSPKTEYAWFEITAAAEAEGGRPVASLVMQLRWMKASSPLYA